MSKARPEYQAAIDAQIEAANPQASRFASANAGSGKTKVLVDRVSRLLLDGTPPDKILCLTYTKAAASEMQSRLFRTLGSWSVLSAKDLTEKLDALYGAPAARSPEELTSARQLFASALETPEGLKVQTIHAFCERILGRFPIEAGIAPGFEPLDDLDAREIQAAVEDKIMSQAWANQEGALARAVNRLAASRADTTLDGIFAWMGHNTRKVQDWQASGGLTPLADALGLNMDDSPDDVAAAAWRSGPRDEIKAAANALMQSGNDNDVKRGQQILGAFTAGSDAEKFWAYAHVVLTQSGTRVKTIATQKAPPLAISFWQEGDEPDRVVSATDDITAQSALMDTRAVYVIACDYVRLYEHEKRARRVVDFNDQIFLVRDLLTRSEVADWVKYKLDGGVDHILVDEAQDTSPVQWEIISAIEEGFARPDPDYPYEKVKTFFAVGDEKQSIYSFQGARPEKFIEIIRAHSSDRSVRAVKMQMSFRSAKHVLDVVDAVFEAGGAKQRMFDPAIDPLAGDRVEHQAYRKDAGLVELWPLTLRPEAPPEELPANTRPVDAPSQASAREQLALRVATQIDDWLKGGELIYDRELNSARPLRPGDVLILVQRRNDFFEALIRRLKLARVPVAGADRLVISSALIVQDLMSLTRFVLLPGDDLSLAEVLKSPLFGWDDVRLEDIAFGRRGSLWQALRASQDKAVKTDAARLDQIIALSNRYAPFEFYTAVLDTPDAAGKSYKQKFYERLGMEAQDALEAFLARALAFQRRGAPSLQRFLGEMTGDEADIKREMDAGRNEVRVMTVHGAKGLEAPLVILPDTTRVPTLGKGASMFPLDSGGFAYLPSDGATPPALAPVREASKQRMMEEYLRLLYVAMTRAESRLIICGHQDGRKAGGCSDDCWYREVSRAFEELPTKTEKRSFGEVQFYGARPKPPKDVRKVQAPARQPLPEWAFEAADKEEPRPRPKTPSQLIDSFADYSPAVSAAAQDGVDQFTRGNLTHKLLEILPDIEPARRKAAAQAFLKSYRDLPQDIAGSIRDEVMAILEAPEFAAFFGPGSQAEVSLGGRVARYKDAMSLSGQIDRLAITPSHIYIIDYKSNRQPPDTVKDVPQVYLAQMGAYRDMLREIYPERDISCALLWTDGPQLMILDDNSMDAALTEAGVLFT